MHLAATAGEVELMDRRRPDADSLPDLPDHHPGQPPVEGVLRLALDQLWAVEAEDRVDAYERGEIQAIPAEDVFNAIKNRKR